MGVLFFTCVPSVILQLHTEDNPIIKQFAMTYFNEEFHILKRKEVIVCLTCCFVYFLEMTPVERFAIRFLESSGAYITLEQIKAAKVC